MATKKRTKQTKADPTTKASAKPAPSIDQAWQIASVVNLRMVLTEEIHVKRTPEAVKQGDKIHVNLKVVGVEANRHAVEDQIHIGVTFSVEAQKQREASDADNPAFRLVCKYILFYDVPGLGNFTDEAIIACGQTTGVFNAWPYLRELVHSMTLHAGIPAIVLPSQTMASLVELAKAGTDEEASSEK